MALNFLMRMRYDANEASHIKDLVGGFTITAPNGAPIAAADPFGGNEAFRIKKAEQNFSYIQYSGAKAIPGTKSTLTFWGKFLSFYYNESVLSGNGDNTKARLVAFNNNNNQGFALSNGWSGNATYTNVSYTIPFNEWHFYEVNTDGNIVRFFVDGVLLGTKNFNLSPSPYWKYANNTMNIGMTPYYHQYNGFDGDLFDVCIIDGILHTQDYDVPTGYLQLKNQGIIISNSPINLLDKTAVTGITTEGIEPTGTTRHVAFKVDDVWNKLTIGSGGVATLTALSEQNISADSLITEGNTPAQLADVTSVPGFVGKLVYPALAMYAADSAAIMPTFGMTIDGEIDTTINTYTYTDYSQEYSFGDVDVPIVSCSAETTTTGNGTVALTARLKQGGVWSEYMSLEDVQMQEASAIQFKAVYTVQTTSGADSCKIDKVTVTYNTAGAVVSDSTTDIVTVTQEFTNDLVYVRAYAKHEELKDAIINAFCSLRKTPQKRDRYQIGNGTGSNKVYQLPDFGVNQDTLMIYVDGNIVQNFSYNTETSQVSLVAPNGSAVSASYEYWWELSDWIEMTKGGTQKNDSGLYTTEYTYVIPTHEQSLTVTAVKFSLERPEGTVTNETIGVGTGKRQQFYLPHLAKKETVECTGQWNFNQDRNLLTVIMPEGEDIVVSYDWIAETPELYAVSAGWAED